MAHILLVEDELLVSMLFQNAIEAAGHRVTVAANGFEGLDADRHDPADAVVTDLTMPRMGGRELLDRLRSRRPGLPALVVTGFAGMEQFPDANTSVVAKPISPDTLVRELDLLLADDG